MQFIAYLFQINMSANTISTYIAALASINKLYNGEVIFRAFLITKLLVGVHNIRGAANKRLPIQIDLLHKITDAVVHNTVTPFMQFLIRAMFLLAFHAFLRVGELTMRSSDSKSFPLHFKDLGSLEI